MDRIAFYDQLRAFLVAQNPDVDPGLVTGDANLWDLGCVDSFGMVELILFLETTLGAPIAIERHSPRTFHTMARIYDAFVAPAAAAVGGAA